MESLSVVGIIWSGQASTGHMYYPVKCPQHTINVQYWDLQCLEGKDSLIDKSTTLMKFLVGVVKE